MRIAMVGTSNPKNSILGGRGVHEKLLEYALSALGHRVERFHPGPLSDWSKLLTAFFFALRHPKISFSRTIPEFKHKALIEYYFTRFFGSLDLSDFDIVHAHDVIAAGTVRTERLVLTIHGYYAAEVLSLYNFESEKDKKRMLNYLVEVERRGVEKAKHIIAIDFGRRNYLIKVFNYPEDRITVLPNAVDTHRFRPVTELTKLEIREQLGLPRDKIIVLVPKRYAKEAGVHYAARAIQKLNNPDFFFVFAGRGPLKRMLEDILRDKKNVLITDGVPHEEVHLYYQASDIVLLPSITTEEGVEEGSPLSMLEGMACGKIVVCTDLSGFKEVIEDGKNGFIIEQRSEEAIVQKLLYIRERFEELEEVRKGAREQVLRNHNYIEYAKKVVELYRKVIENNPHRSAKKS